MTVDDIEMVDLDGVYENGKRNDVAFISGNELIVLAEHQSTLNENMRKLLNKCQQLMYYSLFVSKVEEYKKLGTETNIAVRKAVEYCIEHDIMKEFMEQHHKEVVDMFTEEWDMEKAFAARKAEGRAEGKAEGKAETVIEMIKDKLSIEKIAQYTKLTVAQVTDIGKKAALL